MNRTLKLLLFSALVVFLSGGCRKPRPYRGPEIEKPTVQVLGKYPPGSDAQALISDFNLVGPEVRYRSGQTEGRTSAVYFMDNGNLHVETGEAGDGSRRLLAVPYFEPLPGTVAERMAKWDGALESPGNRAGKK